MSRSNRTPFEDELLDYCFLSWVAIGYIIVSRNCFPINGFNLYMMLAPLQGMMFNIVVTCKPKTVFQDMPRAKKITL